MIKANFRFSIILFFILIYKSHLFSALQNKILVKIENEIISSYELKNKINTLIVLSNKEVNQSNVDKLKRIAIEQLINTKIKEIELQKYNIQLSDENINGYLNKISTNNIDGLKAKFTKNNLDFKLYLSEVKTQLGWQQLIYSIYEKKVVVNEDDITDDLKKIFEENSNTKEYNISEIEITLNNTSEDEKRIKEVKDQIDSFGFEKIAKQLNYSTSSSESGNLGWINENSLSDKIKIVMANLKIGEVSEPIVGNNNAIFLKLNDIRTKKVENINTEELKKNIIKSKKNDLFALYSNSHLSKLKNNILIEYK